MFISLDKNSDKSMIRQIYNRIRNDILNGTLRANTKLPSSRKLSTDLKISRIVVLEAYDMLISEGYLRTEKGSGTYVNHSISITRPDPTPPNITLNEFHTHSYKYDFRSGIPALDYFPRTKWLKCIRDALNISSLSDLSYGQPSGHLSFRKTIADYLYHSRGISCHHDQIVITSGSAQAFNILSEYFRTIDKTMILEDPINSSIREMITSKNIPLHLTEVDDIGIIPNTLPLDIPISCLLSTPSHQYPLGGSLPIQRRIQLIKYARKMNCFIIEDDYDSEFRYSNAPVESLYELDPERVIYLGSFSKLLMPSVRLGYMVIPSSLINQIFNIKKLTDIHVPTLNQLAMNIFIMDGHLSQHLNKLKKIYTQRRSVLINTLKKFFNNNVTILGSTTGIHLVAQFEGVNFTDAIMNNLKEKGVYFLRVKDHTVYPEKHLSQLIIGYSNTPEDIIYEGIKILYETLH